jgi:hypothetical protein
MKHDIVTFNSKAYKAVNPVSYGSCDGCAFNNTVQCVNTKCTPRERIDGNHVIYKPHCRLGVKQ